MRKMLRNAGFYVGMITGIVYLGGAIFTLVNYDYGLPFLLWTVFYGMVSVYLVAGFALVALWGLTRIGLLEFLKESTESLMGSFDDAWR